MNTQKERNCEDCRNKISFNFQGREMAVCSFRKEYGIRCNLYQCKRDHKSA